MKFVLITLCLIANTIVAFAQKNYDETPPITFGLTGGSNFTTLSVKAPSKFEPYTDFNSPFSLGVNADLKFSDYFSIRPSLIYQGKGGKVSGSDTYLVTNIYNLHYFEIPLDFIGHLPLGDGGANIFLGVGPFISLGLSGNSKTDVNSTSTLTDIESTQKIKFGKNGDFKSLDYGATSVLGFQTSSGFAVGLNVEIGLSNILQNNDLGIAATLAKTATIYVSIGQSF
jgi:hypothetical protein